MYLVSKTGMPARNLDLLNVIFLKVEDNSVGNLFQSIQFGITGHYLSMSTSLIFFILLSISAGLISSLPLFDSHGRIFFALLFDGMS